MREIKFRAYDTEEKIMWEPLTLDDLIESGWEFRTEPYEYTLPHKDYMWSQHDKTVWMQFTGLLDKNGKEIYEGDILDFPTKLAKEDGVVKYENCGFWLTYNDGYTLHSHMPINTNVEIIGNIYENPELLT